MKEIAARLTADGIDPWFDEWEIAPGEDIVARIDAGLAACQLGLIFFSKATMAGPWARAEISTLTHRAIKDGKRVIPVMLDPDAPMPELLRNSALISAEDLDRLVDAIYGRSRKPRPEPPRTSPLERCFRNRLEEPQPGTVRASAVVEGETRAEETAILGPQFRRSYREFLEASFPGVSRLGLPETARRRDSDLVRLGEALGRVLLPGQ